MRSFLKRAFLLLVLLLVCVAGYESVALWQAQQKTEALFRPFAESGFNGLKWSDLNDWQKSTLLKVEDPAFFTHNGVDFSSKGAGITTITQAVVKRLYFEHFTPGFKKIEQSLIARYAVTPAVAKEVQLTAFLNVAYFGHTGGKEVKGFAGAARTYFNKTVQQLDEEEYLKLTAMLIAPNDLKPDPDNGKSLKRVARIKKLIAGQCEARGLADVYLEACD